MRLTIGVLLGNIAGLCCVRAAEGEWWLVILAVAFDLAAFAVLDRQRV